ncbi:hypothetical protein AGLY_000458, partial [Aphis glycines]
FKHIESFKSSGLREVLIEKLVKCNYTTPTPIQKYPVIINGRDMMTTAQTGYDLIFDRDYCEPRCVIMSPTRELAIQIHDVVFKWIHETCIGQSIIYGDSTTGHQRNTLANGIHILVVTPGRLNDFVSRGYISFKSLRFIVLNEADRMLAMDFKPDIEKILNHETMVDIHTRQTRWQMIFKRYLKLI